jgi:hypothetical protein
VRSPNLIRQAGLNACGPAVFFRLLFDGNPVAAASFACELLHNGSSVVGALNVNAGAALLAQDYATVKATVVADSDETHRNWMPETADWMLLSALRDSEDVLIDYLGEPGTPRDKVAGMTLPSTLAGWLKDSSLFSAVENATDVVVGGGRDRLFAAMPAQGNAFILLVDDGLPKQLMKEPIGPAPAPLIQFALPNHYVLLNRPVLRGADTDWINLNVWTWGKDYSGWQGQSPLFAAYYGLLAASN